MVAQQRQQAQVIELKKFRKYRAVLQLGPLEALAPNTVVIEHLRAAGFTNVTVEGTGAERKVTGVWSRETKSIDTIPNQVKQKIKDIKEV